MSAFYLVQIPHSAGTALRLAACRHWGSSRIVSDHGPGNRYTSPAVEELIYLEQDFHRFKEFLQQQDIALLTSSQPLNGLRRIFPASNLITFVSNPIDRLLKSFQQEENSSKLTNANFLKFCQRPDNQNVQSRYLKTLPLELYGFVGISERYSESLELLNAQFDCQLTELATPTGTADPAQRESSEKTCAISERTLNMKRCPALCTTLSDKTIKAVLAMNTLDNEFYQQANELLDTRLKLNQAEVSYIHGKVNQLTQEKISGWAVSTRDHNPCKVRVLINQECVAVTSARNYSSALKERNVSRDGYVGFSYRFPRKLTADDVVSCRIHPTDQLLGGPRTPTEN